MHGDEQHRRVLLEDVLRAVAVVDVPVDNRDALYAVHPPRCRRGDRRRVVETEAYRLVGLGMVAGRAGQREG